MRLTVQVTAEHIADGQVFSCTQCPVALALKAAGVTGAWVNEDVWSPDQTLRKRPLPAEVALFIQRFDNDRSGEPFAFTVMVPAGAIVRRREGHE